jgi:hypothetical protein
VNVRNRNRQAEIDALVVEPEQQRRPYSGAGSSIGGQMGRPENAPTDARGRMAHAARREFVEETEIRPSAEAVAQAAAINTEKILNDKRALTEFLCQPKPLDEYWRSLGNTGSCPLLEHLERGYARDASDSAATAFFSGPFLGFLSSDAFKPFRKMAIEKEVLTILLDFMERNAVDSLSVSNWQKTLLLFVSAHFALPWLQPKPAAPTAAERIQYTVGGRTLIGKAAIAAMSFSEFQRRLKEEPDFQSLVEEVETGKPLSTSRRVDENKPDPYSYNTTVVLRGFKGYGDLTRRQIDDLPSDDYREAMKLVGTPVKSFEAVFDTDGYILAHLEARRAQWHR